MNELGALLRKLRGRETLRDASKRIGISHSYLSILEKGIDPRTKSPIVPSPDTLKRISIAYNYPYIELMAKAGHIEAKGRKNRLEKLRKIHNKTPKELAEYLQISEEAYLLLEKIGQNIDYEYVKPIADLYGVDINYVMGFGPRDLDELNPPVIAEQAIPYNPSAMLRLPVLGSIRAGEPIDRIEYNEGYTLVEPDLLRGHEGFALRVKGDSMSGDRIMDGDIVIVQKTPEVQPHEIAVVAIDGDEATLKRVKKHGDMVMLVPSNPAYEPMLVPAKDVFVIGKVVEVKFWPK